MKKKYIIFIVLMLIVFVLLSSCANFNNEQSNAATNNDKIQLWCYLESEISPASRGVLKIIDEVEWFCYRNNIPLEVFKYSSDILSKEDYILKRNLSATFGNMIIIENIESMRDLIKHHADYTKISSYNKLINSYKDRFCVPFGTSNFAMYIENEAMEYYGINPSKRLITYTEYLEIKQEMKEKGAKFELNYKEFEELCNYYQHINGLMFIDEESEIINDNSKFKKALKKAIIEVYNDIFLHYNINIELINNTEIDYSEDYIYDENSGLVLKERTQRSGYPINGYRDLTSDYMLESDIEDLSNKTFFINSIIYHQSVNFFMHEKITNNKIYDLANYIVNDSSYMLINSKHDTGIIDFMPVFNTEDIRKAIKINDDYEYIANQYGGVKEIKEIRDSLYKMLFQDGEESKEIADYHFFNISYSVRICGFITEQVIEIINDFYERNIPLDIIDTENEEVSKMIDSKINKYVDYFNFYE